MQVIVMRDYVVLMQGEVDRIKIMIHNICQIYGRNFITKKNLNLLEVWLSECIGDRIFQ